MDSNEVRDMFRRALCEIWGEEDGARVKFDVMQDAFAEGTLAALSYDSHAARADGRKLLSHASNHVLRVAPTLLAREPNVVKRFLLHEAIHVGHPRHDTAFEAVAAEVGTASTERGIEGQGFDVEMRVPNGRRYKKVFNTSSKEEAVVFAKEKRAGEGRYRIVS